MGYRLWVIEVSRLGKVILFYNNQSIMVHIFKYDNNMSSIRDQLEPDMTAT